jgi:hypothetical protein
LVDLLWRLLDLNFRGCSGYKDASLTLNNMSNDITGSPGRLCNHILRALGASFLARQRNLKFNYGEYFSKMQQLGIDLFTNR